METSIPGKESLTTRGKTRLVTHRDTPPAEKREPMQTLPGDDVRQIMWRFADRFDLQMIVQAARSVARGPVARLVANGARNTHEWTAEKAKLFEAFDESGITSVFLDPDQGGFIQGPKNLALSLVAFELAWVDGGAATCSLATNLALAPIHERGTPEQRVHYMSLAAPPTATENRAPFRGAFVLTEPLPYVGVDTGMLSGKVRIAEWKAGAEPMLQVEKRGRFITNMAFANFAIAAVGSDDPHIKGTCMVILEETDPGLFDRGAVTKKLVHQLSSTQDPIFNLRVPASRIVGGYSVEDGVIVPRYSHSEVIEAVFSRTRAPVGLMTTAKLLSAVEPIIRYQRNRFRGAAAISQGSTRFELGLQQKEDALHRLVDVWAAGEAGASLGFATARLFDQNDALVRRKEEMFHNAGADTTRAQMRLLQSLEPEAIEFVRLSSVINGSAHPTKRYQELKEKELISYLVNNTLENVLGPAVKLWNTAVGVEMMRHAVSLMGGYGITEDCPGFLGQKWMDAQLEATYEGPEAVQRRQLSVTMTNKVFLEMVREWRLEMRRIAGLHPGTGACTIGSAMQLWLETLDYLLNGKDAHGQNLYSGTRQGVTFPMADALCWLLASRYQILDVLELEENGAQNPVVAAGLKGTVQFLTDLCHVQSARAASEVGRICAELVYGYQRHPSWDNADDLQCCYDASELLELESVLPGIDSTARGYTDVIEDDLSHPQKCGPCVKLYGFQGFTQLRSKLDGCMTGSRLAKDRAAQTLTQIMIPETLDYPT